jgi:hypothetical protein
MGFLAKPWPVPEDRYRIQCPNCEKPVHMAKPPAPGMPTNVSLYKCGWCKWESKFARAWKRVIEERKRAA